MKRMILCLMAIVGFALCAEAKDLVVYFSATGNTQAVAERIAQLTGADLLRIEAAEPYAANPYDDSNRIQNEAYHDLRPGVKNLPTAETMAQYDRIFVGSPIWWHQPAMVVCTFLEAFDLSGKTIVPFFTYGATTYLNESMHKIYKVTPASRHMPETLPEDLNPDDITTPGPADDSGIDMPGRASGVEAWLKRMGLTGGATGIGHAKNEEKVPFELSRMGDAVRLDLPADLADNLTCVYGPDGKLLKQMKDGGSYTFALPHPATYIITVLDRKADRRYSIKMTF